MLKSDPFLPEALRYSKGPISEIHVKVTCFCTLLILREISTSLRNHATSVTSIGFEPIRKHRVRATERK